MEDDSHIKYEIFIWPFVADVYLISECLSSPHMFRHQALVEKGKITLGEINVLSQSQRGVKPQGPRV